MKISTLNQYPSNLSNHENRILKSKLQNLRKCSNEEVDQYDIGLYVCEKNSDLTKIRCNKQLVEARYRLQIPAYIDEKNPKDKRKFG